MELFAIKSHLIHLICHATVIPFESNFLSLEGIQKFNYQLKFFNLTQMKLLYFLKHTAPKILMHFYELFVCVCFWYFILACMCGTNFHYNFKVSNYIKLNLKKKHIKYVCKVHNDYVVVVVFFVYFITLLIMTH